ncbi:MAG: glucoamylase family protein [Verrucomicrobiota bacterium JB022]|nr:glucoamylase family protein [Verrucomicrobiota bacterium JB022]
MLKKIRLACLAVLPIPAFVSTEMHAAPPVLYQEHQEFLDDVQERTFNWFWENTHPESGLVPDRAPTESFSSIAAVGFGLTTIPIGIERGFITREEGLERVLATLRFFDQAPQGPEPRGNTGHKGFYYHFLDMENGERYLEVELSTIDTALFILGALFCQSYFDGPEQAEVEIRQLAETLYRRVEWDWALVRPSLMCMGWMPETGFIPADYEGYNEAMFLYLLALASPTHPIPEDSWERFVWSYHWADFNQVEHVAFAPMFGHQYTQSWIDMRGIQDTYMRSRGIDYFENSRRAAHAQRNYAIQNPLGWRDYGPNIWGLTACDGPADVLLEYKGRMRMFFTYRARGAGADYTTDDGTIAPTAAAGSIAFAPEIVIPALQEMQQRYGEHVYTEHGFVDAFNPSFDFADRELQNGHIVEGLGWFGKDHLGIDQGPIVLMIENYRSGFVWEVMRRNPHIVRGLQRAGFSGGWLTELKPQPVAVD